MNFTRNLSLLGAGLAFTTAVSGCSKSLISGDGGGDCAAQTCAEVAANCGKTLDQCGNVLDCGSCVAGETCGAAGPNVCGTGTCDPFECSEAGLSCGLHADGCGTVWNCGDTCPGGTGGSTAVGSGGSASGGTTSGSGGATGTGGTTTKPECDYGTTVVASPSQLGMGTQSGSGSTSNQFQKADVTRSGVSYQFSANGWGPGFSNQNISWNGTSFNVTLNGSPGSSGQPAGFPTMYCGKYSDGQSGACGLPAQISTTTSIKTGMRWTAGGNTADYNTSYDIWLGDGSNLQSYLMVWLHFPQGQRPAGYLIFDCVTVEGAPGVWDIWAGTVGGKTVISYVRPKGDDYTEVEFDVLDFYRDAIARPDKPSWKQLAGTHVNSVAGGFEIWQSVSNLKLDDFYVQVN